MKRCLLCLLLLLALPAVHGAERILDYHVDVRVQTDASIDVTERITVVAEGQQIRRGIYRDFPTRYQDRFGNRVVVGLEVLDVQRDDRPEPWFTEELSNGVRINTGNDDFLPLPAQYTYTLRYRTTRQLGFFSDHDELYWNAIGTGWIFAIENASVDVYLPEPVAVERMSAEGYTGFQGDTRQDYEATLPEAGHAHWRLTYPLLPRQGFTLVLTFPKGVVTAPTGIQRLRWFLADNRGVLVAFSGLAILLVYCFREWRRVGRDPASGIIIARYEPPAGQTPASLRYLRRTGYYDMRCFASELLGLAVAGCVEIERQKKLLSADWTLRSKESAGAQELQSPQRAMLEVLFEMGRKNLELEKSNASVLQKVRSVHEKELLARMQPRYFIRNIYSLVAASIIAICAVGLGFLVSGGTAVPALVVTGCVMAAVLAVFSRLVRAPTAEGRALLDEIAGFALYLTVAERDELANLRGPDAPPVLDAGRYEMLLPYAVALEVEEAWTRRFINAVGAAAAAEAMRGIGWYHGSRFNNIGDFSTALGDSLTSSIASSSTPPGSSSGSGGGGSSGGGGGGGGGGGR